MRKFYCMLALLLLLIPAGGAVAETTEELADEEVPLAAGAPRDAFSATAAVGIMAVLLAGGGILLTSASGRAIAADGMENEDTGR